MSRILKFQSYAMRALTLVGKTGRNAAAARKQRADFYRTIWREAADVLGAAVDVLDTDVLAICKDDCSTRVNLNYTPLDDPVSLRIAGNKPVVHRMLNAAGIPVPAFQEFTLNSISQAAQFLNEYKTCAVKPAAGTGGGQGVTTGIQSRRELHKAAISAAGYGTGLMIEQQLVGSNLRLLFLDGHLLDAIERRPPAVTGDGKRTVAQLLNAMNDKRVAEGNSVAQSIVRRDQDMKKTLQAQGLSLRSVPGAGQLVQLKMVINDNSAEENVNVTDSLSADLISSARQAVATLGLRLAGVDIVATAVDQSLESTGGAVLEVNSTPGLFFHYGKTSGRVNVAVPILAACLGIALDQTQKHEELGAPHDTRVALNR